MFLLMSALFNPAQALRQLYHWTLKLARHRHANIWLAFIAFIESSFFPIPPDVLLIPMALANRARAFFYAFICTFASVAGGLGGYFIGHFLFDAIGKKILAIYGYESQFATLQEWYQIWGWWIVFAAGFTPLPYKVFTIASGVVGMNPWSFTLASIVSRGGRFFLEAILLWRYGAPIQTFIERYLGLLTLAAFALLIGGFLALKWLG
jgi:membrane protein YqaA with SNARE-associated domain